MTSSEHIYLGHDNTVDLIITEDGVALTSVQMDAINRITMRFGDTIIDSNVAGEGSGQPFDWVTGRTTGTLFLDLAGLSIDAGKYRVEVIIHSTDHPEGVVWGKISIRVKDIPYTPYIPS